MRPPSPLSSVVMVVGSEGVGVGVGLGSMNRVMGRMHAHTCIMVQRVHVIEIISNCMHAVFQICILLSDVINTKRLLRTPSKNNEYFILLNHSLPLPVSFS